MTEYEKEKYELLNMVEKIKEEICLGQYRHAFWEAKAIVMLLESIEQQRQESVRLRS